VHTNEQGKLEITLKLNRTSLEPVVSSFERHDYHVKEVYGEIANNEDIEDKYNLLMNYINM
jgi:acetoin utilization protein AcuB